MAERTNIMLAGGALPRVRHVCAFFRNVEEEITVLLPFLEEGLERGERLLFISGAKRRDEYLHRLERGGIDVVTVQRRGQIEVLSWESYPREMVDKEVMLRLVPELLEQGRSQSYPLTRVVANMEWVLDALPGAHDVVEYEARLEAVLRPYDDPVVCVYDSSSFGGRVVLDVLRTHPAAIVGGVLQENPFYVPPEDYLKELRARQG
jgi:hypothetical protein